MATVSSGGTSERYRFIARNRQVGVKYLCEWLGVSRSGFYDWLKRAPSPRAQDDQQLVKKIEQVYDQSRGTYGSPRVHRALQKQGEQVGEKRVARLMRETGLKGRVVKVTRKCPGLKRFVAAGENLRLDAEAPTAPDQAWVADVTYLKIAGQWRYLAVVMDLYSRRILGWSLAKRRTIDLTLSALRYAIKKRQPKAGLVFHTDRGVEYTGHSFRNELKKHGIKPSVNRAGQCTDNAHMESFFHTLKAELIRGSVFQSLHELRYALSGYINHFYNRQRLHSGIEYYTPEEYERIAA